MKRNEALEFLRENEVSWQRFADKAETPQDRALASDMLKTIAALKQEGLNRDE